MKSPDKKRLSIRDWAEEDRPREKALQKGMKNLSEAELIAILIGSGNKEESAVELSRRILHECKENLNELAALSVGEMCKQFKGIGIAKAISISAALELGKRRKTYDILERKQIKESKDLFQLFEPLLIDLPHEEFWVALMNGANRIIETKSLTKGGIQQTVVDISLLLRTAIEKSAVAIAVAHNHPSGQNFPSKEDEKITQEIKRGCEAIKIRLLDHIIIAKGSYYSFSDNGKI